MQRSADRAGPPLRDDAPARVGEPVSSAPLQRASLSEQAASRLRDMIIEGTLAPGERIVEGEIGARLGVSRTPLREALKTLAGEGLVDLVPAKGAIVRRVTAEAAREMLEVLAELEALAGRLAVARATDRQIGEVRALHDRMMAHYARRRRLDYYKLNQGIHTAIVALAANSELAAMHGQLQARMKRIRFVGHEGPGQWAAAVAEHEAMITALEARDARKLSSILRQHLTRTWERVKGVV